MVRFFALLASLLGLALASFGCGSAARDAENRVERVGQSAQALQSSVFELTFNTAATINVKAGDIIRLKNFPSTWTYGSVEVNFDAATTVPMSLTVTEAGNDYGLAGWNKKIVVPYRHTLTQDFVVKAGSGSLRVTYWVSDGAVSPPDAPQSPPLPTEGPVVRDLGVTNAFSSVNAAGGLFTINGLPGAGYNVVSLVLEARDGKPLAGLLKAGGGQVALSGATQKIMFKEHGRVPVAFELSFPERRNVALKWYTEDRTPASKVVARTVTANGSSLTATYGFAADHAVQNDLSLTFNPADFSDAQPPSFTRLEHNPRGVRAPERPNDINGATYDIKAALKPGKVVQVALPVPEIFLLRGLDEKAATVMHYDDATKVWNEIAPDRVADGYVYFSTTSFSRFYLRALKSALKVVATVALPAVVTSIPELAAAAVAVVTTTLLTDLLVDATKVAYNAFVSVTCAGLPFDTYKLINFDIPNWTAPKPDLRALRNLEDFSTFYLEHYPHQSPLEDNPLTLLANAPFYPSDEKHPTASHYEAGKWQVAAANAKLLLADLLAHEEGTRRFRFSGSGGTAKIVDYAKPANPQTYQLTDVFMFNSHLFAAVPHALRVAQTCDKALGLADEFKQTVRHVTDLARAVKRGNVGDTCRQALLLPAAALDWADLDAPECFQEAAAFKSYYQDQQLGLYVPNRDDQINFAGEFLNVLSAAAWIDPDLRSILKVGGTQLRDEIHAYIGLTHDAYGNNNIPIKAMAGVALWDMLTRGDKTAYLSLRGWLEAKMGDQGGYAEGTGYLQYINDDVPYVMSVMVRAGLLDRTELPQKYLKSADWLLYQSRPIAGDDTEHHFLPVEVDDGKTKDIDFFVYSYLTGDGKYRDFAKSDSYLEHLPVPLGYLALPCGKVRDPALPCKALTASEQPTLATLPDVYFADGVGVVRARAADGMATLSVVAEKGLMREGGRAHDQQDNGSVTLGYSRHWYVIQDTGYNGFGKRKDHLFPRFDNHNVVMTTEELDYHGERANPPITFQDARNELVKLPGFDNFEWITDLPAFDPIGVPLLGFVTGLQFPQDLTFTTLRIDWDRLKNTPIPDTEMSAGGADADLVGPLVRDQALHASHGLEVKHTSTAGVTDRRLLLSYAGNVWVIDRPENKRALRSQMHFVSWNDDNAFQYPTSGLITNELPPLDQNDGTKLYLTQHIVENGSATRPPLFVTALRSAYDAKPEIREFACPGAVCLMNIGAQGQFDEVMIPYWGEQYLDDGNMQNRVRTGQIVLAHRDPHVWLFRLVGEESPVLRATSLGARTNFDPNVVYRLDDDGHFTAHFPDGRVQTL